MMLSAESEMTGDLSNRDYHDKEPEAETTGHVNGTGEMAGRHADSAHQPDEGGADQPGQGKPVDEGFVTAQSVVVINHEPCLIRAWGTCRRQQSLSIFLMRDT